MSNTLWLDLHVGDIVKLRKPHACGSNEWEVVRVGADIGLRCLGCGRRILLPRDKFRRRAKAYVRRAWERADISSASGDGR